MLRRSLLPFAATLVAPVAFRAAVVKDRKRWADVVKSRGIQPE